MKQQCPQCDASRYSNKKAGGVWWRTCLDCMYLWRPELVNASRARSTP